LMTKGSSRAPATALANTDEQSALETERKLARIGSRGLPIATLLGAIAMGMTSGVGAGILVLAGGALLGVIGLIWASLRTLSGDAPLADDLAVLAVTRATDGTEQKRTLLRALKDLEHEHAIGKIDNADFEAVAHRYREEAKDVMRSMDAEIEPLRAKAEEAARAYFKKHGIGEEKPAQKSEANEKEESGDPSDASLPDVSEPEAPPAKARRVECVACKTSNEPDATFCKSCGASLVRTTCVTCGASNEPDAVFCKNCGKICGKSSAQSQARNADGGSDA
jgi:hypothetical protein